MLILSGCIFSALVVLLIIHTTSHASHIFCDSDLLGIQKYHLNPTPRVGGIAIVSSFFLISVTSYYFLNILAAKYALLLCITALPIFSIGLIEDLFKNVKPRIRLLIMLVSALMALYITHVDDLIKYSDFYDFTQFLTQHYLFSFFMTLFFMVGLVNCFNIIDGYNGLASTTALLNFIGVYILATKLNDANVAFVVLVMIGVILGFMLFNYPGGKIFLGDGGAYFIGFIMVIVCLYLHHQHYKDISAYSVFLLNIYPVTEMAVSIIRRKLIHKTRGMEPDNKHLHQLVYHKLVPKKRQNKNAAVLPIMLIFIVPEVIAGVIYYKSAVICLSLMALYFIFYLCCYIGIGRIPDINA